MICPNINSKEYKQMEAVLGSEMAQHVWRVSQDGLANKNGMLPLARLNQVKELFESNPELANSVYEALGFGQDRNYYEGNITPEPNTIFVFGSNPEGRHGAGAAKIARTQFGAIYGQGEGLQGNAYALPTKDLRVKENRGFKSISPKQIIDNIIKLYDVAEQNPNKQFKIAYRNTVETSLNGYTGLEMIEMFNDAAQIGIGYIPSNVIFSKEWVDTNKLNTQSQITPKQKQQAQKLYSQYLDTIFPDSKVKDIVYRGGNLGAKQSQNVEAFTTNKSYAEYRAEQNNTQVHPAILNIQESKLLDKNEVRTLSLDRDEFQYQDYGFTDNKDQTRQLGNFYTVKENNRHILGSKQDVEGFKEFVSDNEVVNIINESDITYTDEEGNPCGKIGLTNATKGTGWKIAKDFKGQPKHSQGGVDITISDSGVSMRRGGKDIKAKHGLLIPNNN